MVPTETQRMIGVSFEVHRVCSKYLLFPETETDPFASFHKKRDGLSDLK